MVACGSSVRARQFISRFYGVKLFEERLFFVLKRHYNPFKCFLVDFAEKLSDFVVFRIN